MLGHHVYFTLHDNSSEAATALTKSCHKYLADHDGIVFFAAGTRNTELTREVNDQNFDVALLVVFRDKAAHDAYQVAPAHDAFIAANKDNWRRVRVFDADMVDGQGQH